MKDPIFTAVVCGIAATAIGAMVFGSATDEEIALEYSSACDNNGGVKHAAGDYRGYKVTLYCADGSVRWGE